MKLLKFLLVISILILAACQPATPTPTSQPPVPTQERQIATQAPQPTTESYPSPPEEQIATPSNQGQSYPAPQTPGPASQQGPSGRSGYPAPGANEAAMITWEEAQNLILEGRVSQITQLHNLTVVLNLKDGSTVKTIEQAIDDVFKVIDQCGDKCSDIVRATE